MNALLLSSKTVIILQRPDRRVIKAESGCLYIHLLHVLVLHLSGCDLIYIAFCFSFFIAKAGLSAYACQD